MICRTVLSDAPDSADKFIDVTELSSNTSSSPTDAEAKPAQFRTFDLPRTMLVVLAIAITAWGVYLATHGSAAQKNWSLQAMVGAGAICAIYFCGIQQHKAWQAPMRRLETLAREVWEGKAPLEELSSHEGHLQPMSDLIAEILHDLRQQKADHAALQEEMRQRVAHRTDALERQVGSLRQQATRDALTSLYNRRTLDQHLRDVMQQSRTERRPLCLLMIDVDYFKTLNDSLGHAAGDDLLRSIGQIIRSAIRDQDAAFRYGGDEFTIVLPGSSRPEGESLAKRLVETVDALTQTLRIAQRPRLSIGLATFNPKDDTTPELLLQQADTSLYNTKAARRAVRAGAA